MIDRQTPPDDAAYEAFAAQFRAYSEAVRRGDSGVAPPTLPGAAPASPLPPAQAAAGGDPRNEFAAAFRARQEAHRSAAGVPPPPDYERFAADFRARQEAYRAAADPWATEGGKPA